jgi:hypothetical protein
LNITSGIKEQGFLTKMEQSLHLLRRKEGRKGKQNNREKAVNRKVIMNEIR